MLSSIRSENTAQSARFEQIYLSTFDSLYSFVTRYLKDAETAKDILQECYIRLWNKLGSIQADEKIIPLLRIWATHITIDYLRKEARDKSRAYGWLEYQDQVSETEDVLLAKEGLQKYRAIIARLPPQQRLVFQLAKEEGLSHQEIAARLHLSIHTIKRHLGEAMNTLRAGVPPGMLTGILLVVSLQSGTSG